MNRKDEHSKFGTGNLAAIGFRLARGGFALFLAFVVTTVLFFMAVGGIDLAKSAVDMSRSSILDTVSFHSADGGLEIGLARLRKAFAPFKFEYSSFLGTAREVRVKIEAVPVEGKMNLFSIATVFEGKKAVASKKLSRKGIADSPGRLDCGTFSEES